MEDAKNDKEYFDLIAQGDESAFRHIFHKYNAKLYHNILKIVKSEPEAQEVIQDLFLRLWLRRDTLTTVEFPKAWLYTVAANLALDALRKNATYKLKTIELTDTTEDADILPSHRLELREVQATVEEAIQHLPESRRQIFIMSRRHQKSRAEIATELNLSESTVKNQLTSALKFVQEYLEKRGNIYLPVFLILFVS